MLKLHSLSASHSDFQLGPIDLEVDQGQVLALCGPNGSGKTTLINVILGLKLPDLGAVSLAGKQLDLHKRDFMRRVGYVPDETSTLFDELTALEHVRLTAAQRDKASPGATAKAEHLMTELDFQPGRMLVRSYSHGMRKKLEIVLALMHDPDLIVIDELRNGLDPLSARAAEELIIGSAAGRGAIVVAATHDMSWVERVQPKLLLLQGGRVLHNGDSFSFVGDATSFEEAFIERTRT